MRILGEEVKLRSPRDAIRRGMALLTEDRKDQGLILIQDIAFNITMVRMEQYARMGALDLRRTKEVATRLARDLSIRPPDIRRLVGQLSGGNQQKVVIAKWLASGAKIFIFDEPTRGIDVGAKVEVYHLINRLVAGGAAVMIDLLRPARGARHGRPHPGHARGPSLRRVPARRGHPGEGHVRVGRRRPSGRGERAMSGLGGSAAKLGCGVVSLGRMGQKHAESLAARVPGARLVAVSDVAEERMAEVMDRFAGVKGYLDWRELVAAPEVEAVVIAAPTTLHAEMVTAAVRAAKPIFCEKPLTLDEAEAAEVEAEIGRAGAFVHVGFMRRYDRGYAAAKRAIEAGEVGRPVYVHCVSRDPDAPPAEFIRTSGGLFIDMCVHDFDLCRWLMGSEVTKVYAQGAALVHERVRAEGDVDQADALLTFANGGMGHVEGSRNARYGYDIRTEIVCTEGTLFVGELDWTPCLTLTRAGQRRDVVPWFRERFDEAYFAEIASFVACVREGRPPDATAADSRRAVALAVAARASLTSGAPVRLGAGPQE